MAIAQRVTQGSVLARLDDLALYRRILVEARRSDLHLDPSETAILAVLRRELGIHQVEHFLIEHHADLQPFWNEEHGFLRAMQLMRTGGLTFAVDGRLVLPEDVVAIVRQTVGLEMKTEARRRLLARISGQDATEILQDAGLKSTGSKEEKLLRIFDNYLPPSVVLDALGIVQLRDLCRDLGIAVSGAKDELSERVLRHFATDGDIAPPKPEAPPPEPEQRVLSPERFELLFQALRQQDLSDILAGIGSSRITGAKEHLVKLVRESRFSELTLLTELGLKQLEYALVKQHLKAAGNKQERAARLVQHFETIRLGAHGI